MAALRRVPEDRRVEFRTSYDRVAALVDNVYLARSFAQKARDAGLDKDPVTQRQLAQAQDNILADLYMKHLDDSAPKAADLEQRARELYEAEPARFTRPAQVYVQQIVVGLKGRTREMAKERAQQAYEEAQAGKTDFLSLATRWSDDPDKRRNGGDLGWNSPERFPRPVASWLVEPHAKNTISPPIESDLGFHIVRLVDSKKGELAPFAEVKDSLIEAERTRLAKKRRDDAVREVRSSATVVLHKDNVEALVIPADAALSSASKAGAAEKPAK